MRADFAAFAAVTKEVIAAAQAGSPAASSSPENPPGQFANGSASTNQQVDFALVLASRQQQADARQAASGGATRQFGGTGLQNLSLLGAAGDAMAAGASSGFGGSAGAALPTLAGNADFSGDSVAVAGQAGSSNPFAGVDTSALRNNFESMQQNEQLGQIPGGNQGGGSGFGGAGGGGFGGGGFGGGGAPGGFGGGGGRRGGGGGGGGFNFRNFNPSQPHGAFFWTGGNGAINAKDFALRGQPITQPAYGSNKYGITFIGNPQIPGLFKDKKDFIFLTLAGQQSSSPFDQYGTVPTLAERSGDFSQLTTPEGRPITIYNPGTGQPFVGNRLPAVNPQAAALLQYLPLSNVPGDGTQQNYQRLTTSETNNQNIGARYIRSFGAGSGDPIRSAIRQFTGAASPGIRQSININFNYAHAASDSPNIFALLGGKTQTHQYSAQLGYTLGMGRLNNTFTAAYNRTETQTANYFTNVTDIAASNGLNILNGQAASPLSYGLPNITFTQFTGFNEQQPSFQTNQSVGLSESSSWTHGKHNVRFGGDIKRVQLNIFGATDTTGTFIFTGFATAQPGSTTVNGTGTTGTSGVATSGSAFADFLLGAPQETTLQAPYQKSYLRENVWDVFAQDDWRVTRSLTLLAGLRYEYFSPYSAIGDRLAMLDTGNNFASVANVVANGVGPFNGKYPSSLIKPDRNNFSPRVGFAVRPFRETVVRGGYGINFANGQYQKFVQNLAFQPPFADVQTNEATSGANISLANGFTAPQSVSNYAVDRNFRLPYVQVWNLDVQRTLPKGIVLNVGYNGAKGTKLDIVSAPGRNATTSLSGVFYDYEQSTAFSNYNALTVRANKRLSSGLALTATYTYSHAIDNASSIGGNGGTGTVVAQNWQDLLAEEGNSSFDIRHKVTGTYVYELPFGPDGHFFSNGNWFSHAVANISVSGTYTISTGSPLTPAYQADIADVSRGSAGSLRPNRVPGSSLTAGAGNRNEWFNTAAFTQLAPGQVYGTASRNSISGPGTIQNNMSLAKTVHVTETRTLELRGTADNVFNTVQYSGVNSTLGSGTYGQVTSAAAMRQFTFLARFRY